MLSKSSDSLMKRFSWTEQRDLEMLAGTHYQGPREIFSHCLQGPPSDLDPQKLTHHHSFSPSSASELRTSERCQRCPTTSIHVVEGSSVVLRMPLGIYHFKIVFGFGDLLIKSGTVWKLWKFYLESSKVMKENLERPGLFLVLLQGAYQKPWLFSLVTK